MNRKTDRLLKIKGTVKDFLLEELLLGEDPKSLRDTTPLVTGGILDSIAAVKLISLLEDRYKVEFEAHEMDVENLNCINNIANIVLEKVLQK